MKKNKRFLAILLALVMVLTTAGIGVFAAEDTSAASVGQVSGVKVSRLNGTLTLNWAKASNATEYVVSVNGKTYTTAGLSQKVPGLAANADYTYSITAINGNTSGDAVTGQTGREVVPIKYTFKMKGSTTLKSHSKKSNAKLRLKGGQKISASLFRAGKYVIKADNGGLYYINRTRARNVKDNHTNQFNYTWAEVENFVNAKGVKSATREMIFVSTYTQHAYHLVGSKGNWKVDRGWECATGKASSPTPTGTNGMVSIWKKLRNRHGLSWWSCFSSYNAFHGKLNGWRVGNPASGGCIRNANTNAKFVYKSVPKSSRIFIY